MIDYIVYSNTDYLDILEIQADHIKDKGDVTLFLNKNNLNLDEVYSKFSRVIFYDNNDPYAKRVLTCLQQIDKEYFILLHDMDIILDVDNSKLEKLIECLKINNLDKIDLKRTASIESKKLYKINDFNNFTTWVPRKDNEEIDDNSVYLIIIDEPGDFIYNVNPSIWKKTALYDIVNTFQNRTYRDIENIDVQHFCKKLKVLGLHTKKSIDAGYYNCLELFKYLHITHSGKLLELNPTSTTRYGQSYLSVRNDYLKIIEKYNLRESDKWINYE